MKTKPRENCIVCERKIFRSSTQTKYKQRRGKKDLTCSKYCSKIYTRVSNYIRKKIYRDLKK